MPVDVPGREPTGRTIVVFHRHRAAEALDAMTAKLGVRRARLAAAEDFTAEAPRAGDDGLVFNRIGIAVLRRSPEETAALPATVGAAIVAIRPEYVLRIPRFRVAADRAPALRGLSLGDGEAWPLDVTHVIRSGGTGKGVRVAVLDSGIAAHPDLLALPADAVASFVAGDPSSGDPIGHGTHCAGVLVGALRPRQGARYGVAPNATLFVGRVADREGNAPESVVVAGIAWALRSGCRIISLSLGVPAAPHAGPDPVYEKIAAVAAESGCLLVAAAGNESLHAIDQPAASDHIMGVTASTRAGVIAIWANRGEPDGRAAVDLTAPGVGIRSAWNDGGYRVLEGTSSATPIVAGVAALYCERFPGLPVAGLWRRMSESALRLTDPTTLRPLPPTDAGAGLVQAPS